jgi:hypothetical protein
LLDGVVEFCDKGAHLFVECRTKVRRDDAASGAPEQLDAERALEVADPLADHRFRDVEAGRRGRDAAGLDDLGEGQHIVEMPFHCSTVSNTGFRWNRFKPGMAGPI